MRYFNLFFKSNAALMLLAIAGLSFFGCKKYDKDSSNINNPHAFQNATKVTSSFYGFVVDEAGDPMQGVTVSLGNNTFVTDSKGLFYFNDVLTYQNVTKIVAAKTGYFKGIRSLRAKQGDRQFVKIRMMSLGNPVSVNGLTGGSVIPASGGRIDFPASSLALKSDITNYYTGPVNVYARRLDPADVNLGEIMPGDLRGVNSLGYENSLQTYGMMAVEMYDASGNPVDIAKGKTATITMPIATNLISTSPATMPLWHFDEAVGIWKEEGFASRDASGNYVGQVSHFSFWNCDYPGNLLNFDVTLQDNNGNALQNYQIVLSQSSGVGAPNGYGWTNANGYANGSVPQMTNITMQVLDLCGNVVYTSTFSTMTSNINLGTIVINNNSSSNTTTIQGAVTDCFNNPLANAFVSIYFPSNPSYNFMTVTDANGNYTLTSNLSCIATATSSVAVTAYDLANSVSGNSSSAALIGDTSTVNVQACGTPIQFIIWSDSVNGVNSNYSLIEPNANFSQSGYVATTIPPYTSISGYNNNTTRYCYFTFFGLDNTNPNHFVSSFSFFDNNTTTSFFGDTSATAAVNLLNYGTVGNPIEGNFSGQFADSAAVPTTHYINCNFRVNRQF